MKRKSYRNLLNHVPVYGSMPDGWKEIKGAQTAPCGYVWIFNCKSPFGKGYRHALLQEPCLYGWKGDSCRYFIDVRNRASVIEDNTEINIDKMKAAEMRALLHKIYEERIPTTVVNCMKPNKDEYHPTMKPVRLFGYQMANSSRPGDIILDSFGGSGTTIVAAEQLGRKARLMEYDPHYCDVIIARWEKLTGQKAVKIEG